MQHTSVTPFCWFRALSLPPSLDFGLTHPSIASLVLRCYGEPHPPSSSPVGSPSKLVFVLPHPLHLIDWTIVGSRATVGTPRMVTAVRGTLAIGSNQCQGALGRILDQDCSPFILFQILFSIKILGISIKLIKFIENRIQVIKIQDKFL
jgi:hypothetical protein